MFDYREADCAIIYCNHQPNCEGSNMMSGFPVWFEGREYHSTEALYQILRYPRDHPEIAEIIAATNIPQAFEAKKQAYRWITDTRPDWNTVKLSVMEMVIRLKTEQHRHRISEWLIRTGNRDIVEKSRGDAFWGAKPISGGMLRGYNSLGNLWMIIREEMLNPVRSPAG